MRSGGRLHPFTWESVTEEGKHNAEQLVPGLAADHSAVYLSKPALHAQCTWATLSATAMWLLHCCSHKRKRSSGVVGASLSRDDSGLFKGRNPTGPFRGGPVAPLPLRVCFCIWRHSLISPKRVILWKETTRDRVFCWKTFGGSWSLGSLFLSFRKLRCTEGWGQVGRHFLDALWLLLPIWKFLILELALQKPERKGVVCSFLMNWLISH